MLSVCVCVCVCVCSQPQSLRAQHLSVTRARGARQAELWGRGGEDPLCGPSLLFWDEAWDPHPGAGCIDGEAFQEVVPMAEQC